MLTIVMSLFLALSISASATETSGNCGTNGENNRDGDSVKWEIRDDGKTLVFSGNGEMEGFAFWPTDSGRYAPWWYGYQDKIGKVIIEDGVKNIGRNALRELPNLTSLEIPGSVERIDYCGVYYCENLKEVTMHEGLKTIGDYAFEYDYALETVVFPSTLESIGKESFRYDDKIKDVWYYGYRNEWSDISIGDYNDPILQGNLILINQILDYSKWYSDEDYHWHKAKSDTPYQFDGPREAHYDNTRDGTCDVCGKNGLLDTSRTLTYIDENGSQQTVSTDVKYLIGNETELKSGWYAVGANLDFGDTRLKINGDVKLILKDNCGMTLKKGIYVPGGSTLTVYSQSIDLSENNHMGYIKVTGPDFGCAGIGSNSQTSGGKAVFYGGDIEAQGGDRAAGIGSGQNGFGNSFTVEIHNGRIKAHGGSRGAGIGSGYGDSSGKFTVTIDGGYVEAYGGSNAAGIGSGYGASAEINISGGTVRAWGGYGGPGIGAGDGTWALPTIINLSGSPDIEAHGGEMDPNDNIYNRTKADDIGGARDDTYYTLNDNRDNKPSGFTLSGGNLWIVIAGGAVILGGVAAIVIASKKKKAAV